MHLVRGAYWTIAAENTITFSSNTDSPPGDYTWVGVHAGVLSPMLGDERFGQGHIFSGSDDQADPLMKGLRFDVEHRVLAIGRGAARDFREEGQRVALVEQPQLTPSRTSINGVEVQATLDEVPMKVHDQ